MTLDKLIAQLTALSDKGCGRIVWGNTVEEAVSVWNEGAKTDDETTP